MEFRAGQRVRCVNNIGWVCLIHGVAKPGPAFGQICTTRERYEERVGAAEVAFLTLEGFDPKCGFTERLFLPLGDGESEIERMRAICADPPIKARELAGAL